MSETRPKKASIDLTLAKVTQSLRERGFAKRGRRFRRFSNGRLEIIAFQADRHDRECFFVNAAVVDEFLLAALLPELPLSSANEWDGTWFWRIPPRGAGVAGQWRVPDVDERAGALIKEIGLAIDEFTRVPNDHVHLFELVDGRDPTGANRLLGNAVARGKAALALAVKLGRPSEYEAARAMLVSAMVGLPSQSLDSFLRRWPLRGVRMPAE
jgi:hypothetical protein